MKNRSNLPLRDIWTHIQPSPMEIADTVLRDHSGNAIEAMRYCERMTMAGYTEAAALLRELAGCEQVLQVQAEMKANGKL